MPWSQAYDPLGHPLLSTLLAALPIVLLLGALGLARASAPQAALAGLIGACLVAGLAFHMPPVKLTMAALYGAAYGLFPIGWIIVNVIFLYQLTLQRGLFAVLRDSLTHVTRDRRLQLLLVAFCFGAFFEGAAGFGTPVAVTAAILIGLGFGPLEASGLSLIANTAPVAFGALGTPMIALNGVTGLPLQALSAQTGRILPLFSLIVPFWLVWAYAGFRGMKAVWPALLVAGAGFALPQYLVSNFHGPWLVDVVASISSIVVLVLFLMVWQPREPWTIEEPEGGRTAPEGAAVWRAWIPWLILSVTVFCWGVPAVKNALDHLLLLKLPVPGLDQQVLRMPPVVAAPHAEGAVFTLNALSFTGTGILLAAVLSGWLMGYRTREMAVIWWQTLKRVRTSLITVSLMLALGFVTRYSGLDATLGLAFARSGTLYPFFGTLLGWLGVALTGSDTSSNVLFGGLQKITAEQLHISGVLMAAANSTGGVMGKMIDAQSIVVASTATHYEGHEGEILRYVFFHSLALAALVGLFVTLQAYVFPFTALVVR